MVSYGPTEQPPHTTTSETPFSLSYGIEAVIPAEIEVPCQRRRICLEDAELNEELLIHQLDMIEERRKKAAIRVPKLPTSRGTLL